MDEEKRKLIWKFLIRIFSDSHIFWIAVNQHFIAVIETSLWFLVNTGKVLLNHKRFQDFFGSKTFTILLFNRSIKYKCRIKQFNKRCELRIE